ncbi:hypothetical protein PGT21_007660 [Puccinia graminis f. sp. tritici]|uniref:Uncharacterized protein n=1 Tax=Puccinia graminis f. sp. tritici TaxID=56615 RepID=A0A5B0M3H6_PUCGR|nr:hypothetical protein PGT21_007660 [Puccinia graminis f. sp. tritici]KAA1090100.1 hypothetical protein PGTUg99_035585 [Puccinia graminis f. sp. tritici]
MLYLSSIVGYGHPGQMPAACGQAFRPVRFQPFSSRPPSVVRVCEARAEHGA